MPAAMLCIFVAFEDIHLSQSATEYDFSEGVTGFKDLKEAEFIENAEYVGVRALAELKTLIQYKAELGLA